MAYFEVSILNEQQMILLAAAICLVFIAMVFVILANLIQKSDSRREFFIMIRDVDTGEFYSTLHLADSLNEAVDKSYRNVRRNHKLPHARFEVYKVNELRRDAA